jgi:hypothetical protein
MSRKTAMAEFEALCDRAENNGCTVIQATYGMARDVVTLAVALRSELAKVKP